MGIQCTAVRHPSVDAFALGATYFRARDYFREMLNFDQQAKTWNFAYLSELVEKDFEFSYYLGTEITAQTK